MNEEILDVLIVGSGISGIGAGAHLSMKCPNKKYLILECEFWNGGHVYGHVQSV